MKFYVATIVNYVIVEADNEVDAIKAARPKLSELAGREITGRVLVRPATDEEIKFDQWHRDHVDA